MAAEEPSALGAALDALAAERLGDVIAQAQADAEARVRAVLADAFTRRMLELAGRPEPSRPEEPARPEPSRPEPEPARPAVELLDADDAGQGLYLLAIVDADAPIPPGRELLGRTLARLEHAGLAAVYTHVPLPEFGEQGLRHNLEDLDWLERVAREHEAALEALCERLAVIPVRMCTIYRSEQPIRELLADGRETLTDTLEHLGGRREWGVKIFQVGHTAAPAAEASPPPASGTDYMLGRQREQAERRRRLDHATAVAEGIHRELVQVAVDAVANTPQRRELSGHPGEMLLNGAYLIEETGEQQFLELVERLAEDGEADALDITVTGPWPAYNFVSDPIGASR